MWTDSRSPSVGTAVALSRFANDSSATSGVVHVVQECAGILASGRFFGPNEGLLTRAPTRTRTGGRRAGDHRLDRSHARRGAGCGGPLPGPNAHKAPRRSTSGRFEPKGSTTGNRLGKPINTTQRPDMYRSATLPRNDRQL